jgi:hypothetical protein
LCISNYLPGLALDCDPPYLRVLNSLDYRGEPPAPAQVEGILRVVC